MAAILILNGASCTSHDRDAGRDGNGWVTIVADYHTSLKPEARLRVCSTGELYRFTTGSYGASQFIRMKEELGAEDELLLGEFVGSYMCLSPWACIRGEQDAFAIVKIVSLRRDSCPPRGSDAQDPPGGTISKPTTVSTE